MLNESKTKSKKAKSRWMKSKKKRIPWILHFFVISKWQKKFNIYFASHLIALLFSQVWCCLLSQAPQIWTSFFKTLGENRLRLSWIWVPYQSISMSVESIPKIFGVGWVQHWKKIFFCVRNFCRPPETPLWCQRGVP